jgi:hypothetical protein
MSPSHHFQPHGCEVLRGNGAQPRQRCHAHRGTQRRTENGGEDVSEDISAYGFGRGARSRPGGAFEPGLVSDCRRRLGRDSLPPGGDLQVVDPVRPQPSSRRRVLFPRAIRPRRLTDLARSSVATPTCQVHQRCERAPHRCGGSLRLSDRRPVADLPENYLNWRAFFDATHSSTAIPTERPGSFGESPTGARPLGLQPARGCGGTLTPAINAQGAGGVESIGGNS